MFCNNSPVNIKQFSHRLLGSPNVFVFIEYLYAILLPFGNKGKEFCRTVSYIELSVQNSCSVSYKHKVTKIYRNSFNALPFVCILNPRYMR